MSSCQIDSDQLSKEQIKNLENIISKLPSEDDLNYNSDVLKALADPTRLKIVYILKYGELCVCEIISALDKPQPTVSHHLNVLKKAGFLKWRKEGVWTHYSLKSPKTSTNIDKLIELVQLR
ncbi:MAG TPA: metalloregulator ArsR/SmtB family transcription factor [Methanobacterium sp.]|nr:MAG: winged helix-turn-helix transcriptional regulator [Methanobacterium sp.]HOI72435.1 metalloregulator ArsR/SmtB family transcription factor [Methanobacterium sp.]